MDEVQAFIARNQHQFGYIMQEASKQWIQKDPVGALTVGPCNIFIEKDGNYHELQDKVEQQQQEIERLKAFHDYFRELYGEGLEVANWHLNGDLEPFDDIFNSAEEEMDK